MQLLTRRRTPATAAAFGASFFSGIFALGQDLGGATRVTRRRFRLDGEERLEYILSPHLAPVGCLAPHPLLQLFHPNVRNSWLFHEGRTATTDDANFVFFARVKPGSLTLGVA